ncbi:TonB-dependent receptor domain-containing protein [Chitinophaga sp. 22321]|uniref:TonB-dependent receptor n=1 Tax=Chitinophaga hostae TaxID=2831022 RepID=A0ABS5J3P9_9BACT|nr:TonB-dependent receptor [Chitinophaga hostae]MBS0029676.1 TonB-dependent receptor [Chitinophaga hostae]
MNTRIFYLLLIVLSHSAAAQVAGRRVPDSSKKQGYDTAVLKEGTTQLGVVTVKAVKPLVRQQANGVVVNVAASLLSKGSTVLAILERSPGVVIDYRNNSITLNGKSGIAVMLNGKLIRLPLEQVVTLLTGMSGTNVEKIELLTTPGANYDAEGSAGIINIVLKQNRQRGTNGTLSLTGGYGKGEKATGSIHLARNTTGSQLYGAYTYSRNRTYSDMFIDSDQNMPVFGGVMNVLVWDTTRVLQNSHDINVGADFNITPKLTVGGNLTFNSSNTASNVINRSTYNVLPDSLLLFDGVVRGKNRWNNLASAIYLEKKLKENEKISADIEYLLFKNSNPSIVQSIFLNKHGAPAGANDSLFSPQQQGYANTSIQVGVVKIDYTRQLNSHIKLETGVKGTYTYSRSSSRIESLVNGEWISRKETVQDVAMKEAIGAVYGIITTQLTPSASMVLGVRYEYANSRMRNPETGAVTVNRTQGVFFPNIAFTKKLDEQQELQLSYTKRISRPAYNDLASYVTYSDPSAVYSGNPLLRPTINSTVKLGYNYGGYSLAVLLSRENHPIARYQLTQRAAANLLYVSPQNLVYQNSITLQAYAPWKLNDWWSMNAGFTGGLKQFKLDYTKATLSKTYFAYSLNASELFELPANFAFELSGWYNSMSYNGTIKVAGFGALNAGIKKTLMKDWGSLQLSWTDILRTVQINTYYGTLTEEAFSIRNHVSIHTESGASSLLKLTYSRSFGAAGIKSQPKRNAAAGDEGNRVRRD